MTGLKMVPPTPIPAMAMLMASPLFLTNQLVIIMLTGIREAFKKKIPVKKEEMYR